MTLGFYVKKKQVITIKCDLKQLYLISPVLNDRKDKD